MVTGATAYDPPAGTFPYFPQSIFAQQIAANPTPNPNSSAWIAKLEASDGSIGLGTLQFAADPTGYANDYMFPIYKEDLSAPAYTIHCTEPWGTCPAEGKTIHLTSSMVPEDCSSTTCSGDRHIGYIQTSTGYEIDTWGTTWPPSGSTLDIAWGGECPLSGTGYVVNSGCSSTASGTPLSVGIIRVKDLLAAIQTGGTLPYALQAAVKCSNGYVAPATGTDGTCSGGVPQGERAYLAMSISQINATAGLTPIAKVILRTLAVYGLVVTDTNGGQSGFSLQSESGLTYTAVGMPNPWLTQFVPEAQNEGISTPIYGDTYQVPLSFPGINLASEMKFE